MTVTIITLLKRREGMSVAEFRAWYEDRHRLIGEAVLGGYASRYVRRYLSPMHGAEQPLDYDVVMEIDFPDATTRDACFAAMQARDVMTMIVADEENLFDRSRIRSFCVTEAASKMPPPDTARSG